MRNLNPTFFFLALLLPLFHANSAGAACKYRYKVWDLNKPNDKKAYLCVLNNVNMSRAFKSRSVLQAAKAYTSIMKKYMKEGSMVYVTSGYRSAADQERTRASGVQAGASSGRNQSAHIYGAALDLQIRSGDLVEKSGIGNKACSALRNILPILDRGGAIMEGYGGGSLDVHVDDNWGRRKGFKQAIIYASERNGCRDGKGAKTLVPELQRFALSGDIITVGTSGAKSKKVEEYKKEQKN